MSKVREILKEFSDIDGNELGEDKFVGHHDVDKAEQAILAWVSEVIGEDEEQNVLSRVVNDVGVYEVGIAEEARNELRAEQRKRAGLE